MSLLPISRSRIAVIAAFSSALFKIVDPGQILSTHASQITKNEQCLQARDVCADQNLSVNGHGHLKIQMAN